MGGKAGGDRRAKGGVDPWAERDGDISSLLVAILQSRLPPDSWVAASNLAARWRQARVVGDSAAAEQARRDLAALGSLAFGHGDEPPPGSQPPPAPIRQQLGQLVHDLGRGFEDVDPPAPTPVTGPEPAAFAARFARLLESLPIFDRSGVAYAGTDPDRPAGQSAVVGGLRVDRRVIDRNTVEVVVTTGSDVEDGYLVALSVRLDGTTETLFFLPLWQHSADARAMANATVLTREPQIATKVSQPFPAALLNAHDAADIQRSVGVATVSGRNAWRRIATARPPGDAVRAAIVAVMP